MRVKEKKESVKVENKDNSSYYIAIQDLKALDFIDKTVNFVGFITNFPCIYSIKYNKMNRVYTIHNDINDNVIFKYSLSEIKAYIVQNIYD